MPEYLFRPEQILKRLQRKIQSSSGDETIKVAALPWGPEIQITTAELIQNSIWFKGVYDIVASETIWRLTEEGETCLDIGAHIGYMTSIMTTRVGPRGKVISFEPHPVLFRELKANVGRWRTGGNIRLANIALSDKAGTVVLELPNDWAGNRGVARVVSGSTSSACETVPAARLSDVVSPQTRIGVAKLDVEGHELSVLRGAEASLKNAAIRDIVFEDLGVYPTPVMRYLEDVGYSVYSLGKAFRGPRLSTPDRRGLSPRDDPNYLATVEPKRAERLLNERGWRALRS